MNIPQNIIVHHSITPRDLNIKQTETSIERTHKERGFPKSSLGWHVGYHYMIFGDGTIKQYRKDIEDGAHTKEQGMNFKSLGICLIGDFDKEDPSPRQIETLAKFLAEKVEAYKIPPTNIYPHRRFAPKSCYGNRLSDDWARNLINMNITVVFAKRGTDLKAILQEEHWIGFADIESYNKHIAGTKVVTIWLDALEFDKLEIRDVLKK